MKKYSFKLGCCVNMLVENKSPGESQLPHLIELGYDYAELPLAQMMDLSEQDFSKLRQNIHDIPVEACNNFFPAKIRLTGEEVQMERTLDYVKRATNRAAALGVRIIVLGSSGAKNIPENFPYQKAEEQFIILLHALQDIVAPLDITIALEPLNKTESNFINNLSEGLEIMHRVNCSHIKILADYYHMRMEDEDMQIISQAGGDLRHVHIAAKNGRLFPKEDDGEDYPAFFQALKDIGYQGRVSIEASTKDIIADGAASATLLRPMMG